MGANDRWFAVVNPKSANGRTEKNWPDHCEKIKQAGVLLDYEYTLYPGHGTELTRLALSRGYNKIIAVGGDGTVNEAVNGLIANDKLVSDDIELAVFGLGTGSDFIRSLKVKNNLESFINSLRNNSNHNIDVGKVTYISIGGKPESRYFINASNMGIGAEVVNQANLHSKVLRSRLTYLIRTIIAVFRYKNIQVSIQTDKEKTIEGKYCGLIVCNGQYIGGGMRIAPQAEIDDGFFDLVVIKDISIFRLLSCIHLIYRGKHIYLPEVEVYRCRSIKTDIADEALLETDGEIPGVSPVEYNIIPQCLTLKY